MATAQTVVITQSGTGSGIDTSYQLGDSIYIVAGGTDTIFTGVATSGGGGGGSGTVTSVAATVPTGFSVTGSPITSSGTLAITNNLTSGVVKSSGVGLSFTSGLVDIITETTGTLTPARGGTGLTGLGTANQMLRVNSGATGLEYFTATFPTGSGAAGQVTYWTGASTQSGSNNLFWDASNNRLGIGTASPLVSLHVKGGFYVDNAAVGLTHRNVAGNIRMFTNLTSDNGEFYLRNSSDANTVLINSSGSSYFNGGNVGIGTATPAATTKLDVVTSSTTNASGMATSALHNVSLSAASSAVYKGGYYDVRTNAHAQSMVGGKIIGLDGYALFQGTQTLSEATGIKGVIQTNNGGTITEGIGIKAEVIISGGSVVTNAYGINIATVNGTNTWGLYAPAGARNYFAGNLGIGVSSPTNKLDVSGTATDGGALVKVVGSLIASPVTQNDGVNIVITGAGSSAASSPRAMYVGLAAGYTGVNNTTTAQYNNVSNGTGVNAAFSAFSGGSNKNIGAMGFAAGGTTNIGGYFALQNGPAGAGTQSAALIADNAGATSNPVFLGYANSAEVFRIGNTGNVGINTNSPGSPLQVDKTGTATEKLVTLNRPTAPTIGNETKLAFALAGTDVGVMSSKREANSDYSMNFFTLQSSLGNTTPGIHVGANNKVGINQDTAVYFMDVKGSSNHIRALSTSTTAIISLDNSTTGTSGGDIIQNGNNMLFSAPGYIDFSSTASSTKGVTISEEGAFLLKSYTSGEATALTAANGQLIYVNTTGGVFTTVGFWGRENGTWIKL